MRAGGRGDDRALALEVDARRLLQAGRHKAALHLMVDTLDLASTALLSAGLSDYAGRAAQVAQQVAELVHTQYSPERVALAAVVGRHLAEFVRDVDARLGP